MADARTTEVERSGAALHLRLSRPEKKNALTVAMYAALAEEILAASADPATTTILVSGTGGDFCAGNDLQDFLAARRDDPDPPVTRFLRAIASTPKILVAAVEGRAIGVGTTMLLHCDLVVAGEGASFSTPFVDLGLVPEAGSSLLLPRAAGQARASAMLLLGEAISAAQAEAAGLVSHRVPAGAALSTARTLVAALLAKPREALLATKRLMRSGETGVAARMEEERLEFERRLASAEVRGAIGAFFAARQRDAA